MLRAKGIFILLFLSVRHNETARILAWFPVPSISHQVVFRPITQELARRGHEVVVVTPNPAFPENKAPENLTEIDVHDISYELWKEFFKNRRLEITDDLVKQTEIISEAFIEIIDLQLNTTKMRDIISGTQKFDLLMIEACTLSALAITEVIKVPVIQVSSFGAVAGALEAFGAPSHPFLYPLAVLHKRSYNLTILEKVQQLYTTWRMSKIGDRLNPVARKMLNKHFKIDVPVLRELMKKVDLLLLNEHPLWSANRPVPPNVVYMGGVHQKPKNDLPQDLKAYLDSSEHGVIYMSFGTNVDPSRLPPKKIQTFIEVFSKLPYDVLWKWNQDELPGRSKNIKISKWLPQSDLLRHPNVKLFITQGGLQSTDEAITAGVPVIGVPFIVDQWYNIEQCVHHGVGLQLDIQTLEQEKLRHAIETVMGDASYQQKMVKLRDLMHDQPMSPLERAVWWTEHVLRHGGARHLRAPAAGIGWADYLEFKLVSFILGLLLVLLFIVGVAVGYVVRLLKTFVNNKKVKILYIHCFIGALLPLIYLLK